KPTGEKYWEPYNVIIVDEAQDVCEKYYNMIKKIYKLNVKYCENNGLFNRRFTSVPLVIIGDEKQCIYKFKGGTDKYLVNAMEEFSDVCDPNWKTLSLSRTFRCTKQ